MTADTKALKPVVDFIRFWSKFYMSTWMFASRIEPAECKVDWITIAAIQIVTVTSVAVGNTDMITVLLQTDHGVMCIWTHVLYNVQTHH